MIKNYYNNKFVLKIYNKNIKMIKIYYIILLMKINYHKKGIK